MESFSIIIPTHERSGFVERLLSSAKRARDYLSVESEVFIIDSSLPADAEKIFQSCQKWDAVYLRCQNDVRRKRNLGIESAQNKLIFFTDSDCELNENTLSKHLEVYEKIPNSDAVLGVTELFGDKSLPWRAVEFYPSFTSAFSFAKWMKTAPWGTCTNFSIRREALKNIGGFDESSPLPIYGEDVDLGLRLGKQKFVIRCQPEAVVLHSRDTLPGIGSVFRKLFLTGKADYYLGVKHRECVLPEFPPSMTVTIFVAIAFFSVSIISGKFYLIFFPLVFLVALVLTQSLIMHLIEEKSFNNLHYRILSVIFELVFELGRTKESLINFDLSRLSTKFLYVEEQLAAERPRRIVQMWAIISSLLIILFLYFLTV